MIEMVIGVLTYNKYNFLENFIENLYANTSDIYNKDKVVVVIANNSPHEDYISKVNELACLYGATSLNFRHNRGTSAAWNAIARTYDCKKIVIANDDVLVHGNWKEAAEASFLPHVGVFSFHAKHGQVEWSYKNTITPSNIKLNFQEVTYPPGSFLMFERKKFDEVGGFDEKFFIGLEEVSFSVDLMKAGYKNYLVGDAQQQYFFLNHYGGATGYSEATESMEHFREKYRTEWPLTREFEEQLKSVSTLSLKYRQSQDL